MSEKPEFKTQPSIKNILLEVKQIIIALANFLKADKEPNSTNSSLINSNNSDKVSQGIQSIINWDIVRCYCNKHPDDSWTQDVPTSQISDFMDCARRDNINVYNIRGLTIPVNKAEEYNKLVKEIKEAQQIFIHTRSRLLKGVANKTTRLQIKKGEHQTLKDIKNSIQNLKDQKDQIPKPLKIDSEALLWLATIFGFKIY